ncbi:unnamed protein product [Schistosoma rodhaini]|uniref:RNA-directed DNA polymerase from mobile element jockey n=1 Tax=Schistosoma rodhaini TaxID=6188 RepID=A0A183R0T3_9TREM|nr:unnamed protein product [Schistosoma rodhaini]
MGRILEELLNRPAPLNLPAIKAAHINLPLHVAPPTIEEIKMVIKQMVSGKSVGSDSIPTEALKSVIEVAESMLHVLFRKICEEEQLIPRNWKKRHIIKIP